MATQKGSELVLYAFEDMQPIGCEESCTINITAAEIITTTKGSGAWVNREYGVKDWSITANGVVGYSITGRKEPTRLAYRIISGTKVVVKVTVGQGFYFGIGVVLNAEFTGGAEGFATYNVTIAADGPLHFDDLEDTEPSPTFLTYSSTTYSISYSDAALLNKVIYFVLVGDTYYDPTDYDFIANNGYGLGVITFNDALPSGKTVKIIYRS